VRLNYCAKFEDDYVKNLGYLQQALHNLNLKPAVKVEKLAKGKFQDNINFLQWLYNHALKVDTSSF